MNEIDENPVVLPGRQPAARFSPGWLNWIWGACCGVLAGLFMNAASPAGSRAEMVGMIAGAAIGTWLIATLFGWTTWRARGRHRTDGRFVFAVVCLAGMGAQFTPAMIAHDQRLAVEAIERIVPRQRALLVSLLTREQPPTAAERSAALRQMDALFDTIEPRLRNSPLVVVVRSRAAETADHQLRYGEALRAFDAADLAEFATLAQEGDIARRRIACERYLAASSTYRAFFAGTTARLDQELAAAGIAAGVREPFMTGARRADSEAHAQLDPVLAAREQLASAQLVLLQHLERTRSRWRIDAEQRIEYTTEAEADELNRYIGVVNAAVARAAGTPL